MSKEFPEYQRQSGIQASEPVTGFGHAFAEVGEASEMIGQMGMAIATNAAVEQATIEGVKAGATPGRTLIPAFTESDRAFVQAYQAEEYQTVVRNGETYLNQSYLTASQRPTAKSLSLFEQDASTQLDNLMNNVSESNKPKIKRELISAYEARYFKLAHAVEAENERVLRNNFKINLSNSYQQIQEFYAMGFGDKAAEKLQATEEYIREQRESGLIESDEQMHEDIKDLRRTAERAKIQEQMAAAIRNGRGSEFLASRANVPATPDNMVINAALQHQFNNYNHLKGTQSHIAKTEALTKAAAGQLSDQDRRDYRMKMTEVDRADFDNHLIKATLKNFEQDKQSQFIRANAGNEVALANADPKALNKIYEDDIANFQKIQGKAPSLQDIANIVSQYKAPIPSFNKQLNAGINSLDPNIAIQSSAIYNQLMIQNPRAIDNVTESTAKRAVAIHEGISAGQNPAEIFAKLDVNSKDLTPAIRLERQAELKEKLKARGIDSPSSRSAFAAKNMGFNQKDLPSKFTTDFMNNFTSAYEELRDEEWALEVAKQNMERVYGVRNGEVMWLPPSKVFGVSEEYADQVLVKEADGIFGDYKKEFEGKNPNFDRYYEFVGTTTEVSTPGELGLGELGGLGGQPKQVKTPRVYQVDGDGKRTNGEIVIIPDNYTIIPPAGQQPSYGIYFQPDGKELPIPIKDPKNLGQYSRFTIRREDLEGEKAKRRMAELEAAKFEIEMKKLVGHGGISNVGGFVG